MESYLKPKIEPSTRSKANAPCKKHPKHRQSPGICSICLTEKLSQLTNHNASSRTKAQKPQSSSSSYSYLSSLSSSNPSSYNSSPVAINYRKSNTRIFRNISRQEMFKKSRSMAFVWQRRKEEDDNENRKKVETKRGFWSKLLLPRRNNNNNSNKGLMHSRTTRERVTTTVH